MKTEKVKSAFTLRTNEITEELHGTIILVKYLSI